MTTRTDIHRPSVINTEDYDFVSFHSHDEMDFGANLVEQQAFRAHMAAHSGAKFSSHSHGGSCHVCGAHALTVARFYHRPSNTYVEVGETCMEKMGSGDAKAFQHFRKAGRDAREAAAGKAKAEAILSDAGLSRAWDLFVEWTTADVDYTRFVEGKMITLTDIIHKLVRYGSLSDKQLAFVGKLVDQIDNAAKVEAARAAEAEAAAPVPANDKRMTVEGKVLTVKEQDSFYGVTTKMLVQHVDGWKVWGTAPSALADMDDDALIGATVRFDAKVSVSDNDPKFGFFSRPTKPEVVTGV